jgi:hypothetical protein
MRCAFLLINSLVTLPAFGGSALSKAEVEQLIQAFGPVMKLHSKERYLMDDPEYILNSGKTALQWGLVHHPDTYETFSMEGVRTAAIVAGTDLPTAWRRAQDDPRASRPDFRCWLHLSDSVISGNQSRAKAFVSVLEGADRSYLDLQFWFFYPFNGPAKFHLTIGRVVDDHVRMGTLRRLGARYPAAGSRRRNIGLALAAAGCIPLAARIQQVAGRYLRAALFGPASHHLCRL